MMSDAAGDDRDGCQAINHISMLEMIESCKFLEETALIRGELSTETAHNKNMCHKCGVMKMTCVGFM